MPDTATVDTVQEANTGSAQDALDRWASEEPTTPADQDAELESIAARDGGEKTANKPPAKPPVRRQRPASSAAVTAPARPYDPDAKVKVVVDGEELEITLDQAIRGYRKGAAADKRFQEAHQVLQQAQQLKELLTKDQRAALKQLGVDPVKFAESLILEQIEQEELATNNPAELERRKEKAERERLEGEIKRRDEAAKQAEADRAALHYRQQYDAQFTAALKKADLPATPFTIMRMAALMQENLRQGLDLTADEIAPLIRDDLAKEHAATIGKMSAEQAVKALPKSFLDQLRKYDLEQVKAGKAKPKGPTVLPSAPRPQRRNGPLSRKEADEALEAWANR